MSTQSKLVSKIKKLLTLANDGGATQHEAESAMAKANMLLLQHNMTLSDVEVSDIQDQIIETDRSELAFGEIREEGQWESSLLGVLCQYNLCHSIKYVTPRSHRGHLAIVGKKENVEIVTFLFDCARSTFRDLSKEAYNTHRKQVLDHYRPQGLTERECLKAKYMGYRMPWIRSYLKGCVVGLNQKLNAEKRAMTSNKDAAVSNKFALVSTNTSVAIKNFLEDKHSNLRAARNTMQVSNDHGAYSNGIKTGKTTQLNRAVGNRNSDNNVKMLTQ